MLESLNSPSICVFDLDHTLVDSPLDLKRMSHDIEMLVRERIGLPEKEERWSGPEILSYVRSAAPQLETELLKIATDIERKAMLEAVLIPHARETLEELQGRRVEMALWTNNDRTATSFVLSRFQLLSFFQLVITRDDVARLKPDAEGLRLVWQRWPEAKFVAIVGDSWVDGAAAAAGNVPFIAYQAEESELCERRIRPALCVASLLEVPEAFAQLERDGLK